MPRVGGGLLFLPLPCHPTATLATHRRNISWKWIFEKTGKHDHEASSSSGRRRTTPFTVTPPWATASQHECVYVRVDQCQHYWEQVIHVPWSDVYLPKGWHLNPERVSMSVGPASGRVREEEIPRHRAQLPNELRHKSASTQDILYWDT